MNATEEHDAQRPSMRWKLGCGCLSIFVLIVLVVVLALQMERSRAARQVKKEIARLRAAGQPVTTIDVDRAYKPAEGRPDMTQEVVAALNLCERKDIAAAGDTFPIVGNHPTSEVVPLPGQDWEEKPAIEAWLALQSEAIETFHRLHAQGGTVRYPSDYRLGFATVLPKVQAARTGVRVLSLSSRVHLHAGDTQAAVEDLLAILALARTLENEPAYVSHLVRVACLSVSLSQFAVALEQEDVSDADLERLQQSLRHIDSRAGIEKAMQGERAGCLLLCQSLRFVSTPNTFDISAEDAEKLAEKPPQMPHDAYLILQYFNRLLEANDDSPLELLEVTKQIDQELKERVANPVQRMQTPVVTLAMPANVKAIEALLRGDALARCADAALACERYRRVHGQFPSGLSAVVPDFLPAIPTDPFSGSSLILLPAGTSCTIYSIGPNQKDDGGDLAEPQHLDIGFRIKAKVSE